MPVVFLASAIVSGVGLLGLVEIASGRVLPGAALGGAMASLVLGVAPWVAFVTWSARPSVRRATRSLREGGAAIAIVASGYVLPFLLLGLALAVPGLTTSAIALAGALMIFGQVQAKARLILTAGQLRAITLQNLRLERRPS